MVASASIDPGSGAVDFPSVDADAAAAAVDIDNDKQNSQTK
jgi:hypothetical protein